MKIPRLTCQKLGPRWWILGMGDYGPVGPYDRHGDAEDDRRGLIRFFRHQDEPGFVTVTKEKSDEQF
jgi:hypothetical protein